MKNSNFKKSHLKNWKMTFFKDRTENKKNRTRKKSSLYSLLYIVHMWVLVYILSFNLHYS
jgi:hypothetical protein